MAEDATGKRAEVVKNKATSCDLCTNHAEPSCVYACPHDAAHRVDPNEFFQHVLHPISGMVAPDSVRPGSNAD
jgi:Fe-S-cluster-containing hydrogenase component 2